jgi:zinc transport system substrate-binding protein
VRHATGGFFLLCVVLFSALPAAAAPSVLVTVKPVHSLVAGVMAGIGEPALLLPAGASPHSYSLRPSDARKLARADLIIRVGPALETFLAKPLANIARRGHVITLMGDNGPNADPHIWLDPNHARRIVRQVTVAIRRLDPVNAARYDLNARKLLARIVQLDTAIAASLELVRAVPYIVFHDGYGYFERHFGLYHVAAIAASPDRKPGARRLRRIRDIIRAQGAKCVFTEPQFSPALARALTRDTDARMAALDPLGEDIAPGPDAWFKMMRRLAGSLRRCLSGG